MVWVGNVVVSVTALFGAEESAEERKDECVRARATSGILKDLPRALPQYLVNCRDALRVQGGEKIVVKVEVRQARGTKACLHYTARSKQH
jgi:hypothetical protein